MFSRSLVLTLDLLSPWTFLSWYFLASYWRKGGYHVYQLKHASKSPAAPHIEALPKVYRCKEYFPSGTCEVESDPVVSQPLVGPGKQVGLINLSHEHSTFFQFDMRWEWPLGCKQRRTSVFCWAQASDHIKEIITEAI